MEFIESMMLSTVYLAFPFCIYLIYLGYAKNLEQKENKLFLDIALYSATYLVMRYGGLLGEEYPVLLFNVPLLVSFRKDRKVTSLILSLVLIFYNVTALQAPLALVLMEYFLYFAIYALTSRRKLSPIFMLNTFILVRGFFLSCEAYLFFPDHGELWTYIFRSFLLMLVFYVLALAILSLLQKGEEAMKLASTVKELEKEKMLRSSLFKITHEIKNPIAVCKGYLDMLDLKDEAKVEKYIPIVKQEISRTLTLMDDYLDYTKIKIEKEEVDLYLLIEDTVASLESLFKKRDILTDFEIPDEELYLELDYNRMKQVLYNLFKNAMEAKQAQKKMKISLRVLKDVQEVKLIIQDNGVGMDEETLAHISEMFYTTKSRGTGLGVALSKEIVELHGGLLQYESKLGKGTKVILTLPYA